MELGYEQLILSDRYIAQAFKEKLRNMCFNCNETEACQYDYQKGQVICDRCRRKSNAKTIVNLSSLNFDIQIQHKQLSTAKQMTNHYENIIKEVDALIEKSRQLKQKAIKQLSRVNQENKNLSLLAQIVRAKIGLAKAQTKLDKVVAFKMLYQVKQKLKVAREKKDSFIKQVTRKKRLISIPTGWIVQLQNALQLGSKMQDSLIVPSKTILQQKVPAPIMCQIARQIQSSPKNSSQQESPIYSNLLRDNLLILKQEGWRVLLQYLKSYQEKFSQIQQLHLCNWQNYHKPVLSQPARSYLTRLITKQQVNQ